MCRQAANRVAIKWWYQRRCGDPLTGGGGLIERRKGVNRGEPNHLSTRLKSPLFSPRSPTLYRLKSPPLPTPPKTLLQSNPFLSAPAGSMRSMPLAQRCSSVRQPSAACSRSAPAVTQPREHLHTTQTITINVSIGLSVLIYDALRKLLYPKMRQIENN